MFFHSLHSEPEANFSLQPYMNVQTVWLNSLKSVRVSDLPEVLFRGPENANAT